MTFAVKVGERRLLVPMRMRLMERKPRLRDMIGGVYSGRRRGVEIWRHLFIEGSNAGAEFYI